MKEHITVLRDKAVDVLAIKETSCVVDATLGSGGHARTILSLLGASGTFIGIDADETAILKAQKELKGDASIELHVQNFRHIDSLLRESKREGVDAILADLGWRMEQFSGNGKGFSFRVDEPLLMTLGNPDTYAFTARDIVNDWEEESVANVLKGYGEERYARRIAHHIAERRKIRPIETTFDLVSVIEGAVPASYRHGRIHPATRAFQGLRIAVNDEFSALTELIERGVASLKDGGKMAIITFHSLEDRIVKHQFRDLAAKGEGVVLTKRPIVPEEGEVRENPRSRSAKLRVFEKHEEKPI